MRGETNGNGIMLFMQSLDRLILKKGSTSNTPLVRNLLSKKKLLLKGNPSHARIKTALIIGGGGMRSAFSAGALRGLEKSGLADVFDIVVGISAGSPICAYFLSGQTALGTSIYFEELAKNKFINFARVSKVMDIDYLDSVFRSVKPLDQEHIRSSRSKFYVTVTDAKTGKGELLDMGDKKIDIIDAICASSALPMLYNKTITIKGKQYCDGAIGNGIPIDFVLQKGCKDILIILNNVAGKKSNSAPFFEKIFSHFYMRKFTRSLRIATLARNKLYNQSLEKIQGLININVGILTPEEMPLKRMSRDRIKMRQVAKKAEEQVREIFLGGN